MVTLTMLDESRFACIALQDASISKVLSAPLELGDSMWAAFNAGIDFPQHWQTWLGSIQSEQLAESNLLLLAVHSYSHSHFDEHSIEQAVDRLFYSLLMRGLRYHHGLTLIGTKYSGSLTVSRVSTLIPFYHTAKVMPTFLEESDFVQSAAIVSGMQAINTDQANYSRLKRGFRAWVRAVREDDFSFRLHQFVRAVEAVMKPDTGQTKKQFIHRGKTFAGGSAQDLSILSDLFDLRSTSEHMNSLKDVLTTIKSRQKEDAVLLRTYQAELLASYVYTHILSNANLRSIFITDDSISEFWKKQDDERKDIWGKPINLDTEASKKFNEHLR